MRKKSAKGAQECHVDLGLCNRQVLRKNDRFASKSDAGNQLPRSGRTGGRGTENTIDGRWNITYLYDISGAVRIDSKIRVRKMQITTESESAFLKRKRRN